MKPNFKQFCFFIFLLAFSSRGVSQVSVGLKGHISTIGAPLVEKEDFFSKKLRPTFNPGVSVFGEYKLTHLLAFQVEVAFRQNRSHFQLQSSIPTIHTSIIDYVRVPMLVKLSQNKKWINFIVFGGPNLGYATSIKSAETIGNIFINDSSFTKLSFENYQVSRFDLALTIGFGIEKKIANKFRTSLDIRYDYGFIDILKSPDISYVNRGFALEMGILIPISQNKNTHK